MGKERAGSGLKRKYLLNFRGNVCLRENLSEHLLNLFVFLGNSIKIIHSFANMERLHIFLRKLRLMRKSAKNHITKMSLLFDISVPILRYFLNNLRGESSLPRRFSLFSYIFASFAIFSAKLRKRYFRLNPSQDRKRMEGKGEKRRSGWGGGILGERQVGGRCMQG